MADGDREVPVGSLRVPRIWYRSRLTVLLLLAAGLLSALWHVYSTRRHWEDMYTGLVDLRPVLLCAWFWLSSLARVVLRWIVGAVCRHGVSRLITLLLFFGMAATALGVFFLGSMNNYAWKFCVENSLVHKMDQNIVKISDGKELSVRIEPHPETKGKSAPYLLETFERYNGEDVMFICESTFNAHEDAILHNGMIIWSHNNVSLNISSRHFVETTLKKLDKSQTDVENNTYFMYKFRSELQIYLLDETDYGEYSCLVYKDYHYHIKSSNKSHQENAPKWNTTDESNGEKRHECRPCRFEAMYPQQELLAEIKCYERTLKEMRDFCHRLKSAMAETLFAFDKLKYESYITEFEYIYYCEIKSLKRLKNKCLETNNDGLREKVDGWIETANSTRRRLMEALQKFRPTVWKMSDLVEGTLKAGEYHLVQVTERLEEMTAAPGAMFAFSGVFHYLDDSDLVTVTYEINDRQVDFCEEGVGACSKIIFLYWLFFREGGSYWDLLRNVFHSFPSGCSWLVNRRLNKDAKLYMEFWKCLCYSSFGTHRFIFHREFHNASLGRITVHNFPHPHSVYIAPRPNGLFTAFRNTSGNTRGSAIETCWGTHFPGPPEHPCNLQEPFLMENIESFWWNEMTLITVVAFVWTVVLLLGLVLLPLLLGRHGSRLILGGEIFPRILPPGRSALGGLVPTPTTAKLYDVYVSYAEEQSNLAETSLAHFLEASDIKVFLRERDILPGRMEHREMVRAIEQSRKFLVIVSPDYVKNALLNDYEFQYILALVHDGLLHQRDVLLYLVNKRLPCILRIFTGKKVACLRTI